MRDNLLAQLEEWDGTWPEAWRPKPGEILSGRVFGYSQAQGMYGPVWVCTVKRDPDGERVAIWLSSTVLLAEFRKLRPRPGERIAVKFAGQHSSRGYNLFKVVVDRPPAEPTLEPLGGERGDPVADDDASL